MGEWNQNEMDEIMRKIENSARDLEVPESLEPENIKNKLKENQKRRRFIMKRFSGIAVAAAMAVILGGTGIYGKMMLDSSNRNMIAAEDAAGSKQMSQKADQAEKSVPVSKKKHVGSFKLADDYDEVYNSVSALVMRNKEKYYPAEVEDGGVMDLYKAEEDMSAGAPEYQNNYEEEKKYSYTGENTSGYSTTNTQVEGVDESDFIKNDGNYLYLQSEDGIHIVDIRKNKMKDAAIVKPDMDAGDVISDIYLDKDRLFVILEKREVELEQKKADSEDKAKKEDLDEGYFVDDVYYSNDKICMELLTYDISDRNHAKLLGTVKQDGSYYDSRKVGDYIYLFSQKWMNMRETLVVDDLVPCVNGRKIRSDCIYTQKNASGEIVISSVNVAEPDKTVDEMVLMSNKGNFYVSTGAIYLYQEDYQWNEKKDEGISYTDITKFTYRDGIMNGAAAGSVRGTIQDVFAISEGSNGILRVLTTEWGTESKNRLYLLDGDLKEKGSLKNIAAGEEVYAARYIGNIAYFITYHNTDPLFAVDISDPEKPEMLGKVKVSGFSDYLHPYGENLLLGIGYETDPKTSERLGVKLVMFDISNPTKLKVKDSVTIKGDYCNAASDYKCALVDNEKNLIGFEVSDWDEDNKMDYKLYSWNGKKFEKQLSVNLGSGYDINESMIRGLYAGSRFYLVDSETGDFRIQSYDMKNEFKKIDTFTTK